MKIAIQGQDYTAALDAAHPLTIERKLNEPSLCRLWFSLPANSALAAPERNQLLEITGDDGTDYFTGYIAASPLPEYAGLGVEGPSYRIVIQALSDEVLLDQMPMPAVTATAGESAGALLTSLVARTGSTLSTQGLSLDAPVGYFAAEPGAPWSKCAAEVAGQARAAYRAVDGALTLTAVPGSVHPLNETDGSFDLAALSLTAAVKRAAANDITVCGEHEPVACVTEYFLGDGVTTQFYLSADPFFPPSSKSVLIRDLFDEPQIDLSAWGVSSSGNYLRLGPGGLTMEGGNGYDGQTALTSLDPVEMGGTLLLETDGVTLSPGSAGILCGFLVGLETQAACLAGFQVTAQPGTSAVTLQPLIQGSPAGTPFQVNPACQYALRLRVHCVESARELALYRSFGDSGPIALGGQWNVVPGLIQMEIQQFTNGVAATPVTLYDGSVASLPGSCSVVPCSSINLIGTMRSVSLTALGSGWVVSTPPSGGAYTRRIGSTTESAECHVERTGKLVFYTGSAPVSGERIAVSYRTIGRAVGRAVNAASQQALGQAGMPTQLAWIGSVTSPAPRSSQDCRNAAQVMEQAASGVSALWSGTYRAAGVTLDSDVWPGDALLLNAPSCSLDAQVVVRTVTLSYRSSMPDLVEYTISFANDWADDLAIKTSATVPADAWLPAPIAPTVLANLTSLTVTALTGSTVTINAGVTPPAGGGFEIRRRDFAFMPGEDTGLVMRAGVPGMTFARETANDRFYIRMYDGSTPPNYSEFSAALFINLPLGP